MGKHWLTGKRVLPVVALIAFPLLYAPGATAMSAAVLGANRAEALRQHVTRLCVSGSRDWRRPRVLAGVADHIDHLWTAQGYRVERQQIPDMGESYQNVLAIPVGVEWSDEPWILAAHYDTVAGTPGADDNASGVAVLLETAAIYAGTSHPKKPVVFAALTLEEPPFFATRQQGARVFVDQLVQKRLHVAGAFVLEMVGYYSEASGSQRLPFPLGWFGYPSTGNFCGLVANFKSSAVLPELKRGLLSAGLPTETLRVPGKGGILAAIRLSDHAAFWDSGFRAVMITDTAFYRNPHYHGARDLPGTLDFEAMAKLVQGLMEFFLAKKQ